MANVSGGADAASDERGKVKKGKPEFKYKVGLTVDITYLSNDVQDQGIYHMLLEIFQTAQMEYKKYRFELKDYKTIESPPDV